MENEKFTFNIPGEQSKPIEVVIKHGSADPTIYPLKLVATGTLPSVKEYVEKSHPLKNLKYGQALIEYSMNHNDLYINFSENPNDKDATVITGKLEKNPELTAFGINKDVRFSNSALKKLIMGYSHCFNIEEAKKFIDGLRNFDVSFTQQHTKLDDRRGNAEEAVKHSINFAKGELPKTLNLLMPLYIGAHKTSISLEIEIDKDGANPVFSFFSLEYETAIRDTAEELISEQLISLSNFPQIQVK